MLIYNNISAICQLIYFLRTLEGIKSVFKTTHNPRGDDSIPLNKNITCTERFFTLIFFS